MLSKKRELTDRGSNRPAALVSTERKWSQLWVRGKWRICGKILRLRYLSGKEMEREKTSEIGIFEKWKRKQKNRKVWVYGKNVDGYNSLDWKNEGQTKMCRVARKSHVQAQNCRNLLMCVRRQPRWPRLRPVVVRWPERIVNNGVREKNAPFWYNWRTQIFWPFLAPTNDETKSFKTHEFRPVRF